jgi:hypothetical protein
MAWHAGVVARDLPTGCQRELSVVLERFRTLTGTPDE